LNANSSTNLQTWDFESLHHDYVESFLSSLSHLAEFRSLSQVLHYGALLKTPVQQNKKWFIPEKQLSMYINPHQWGLDLTDTSTAQPVINLVLYVPGNQYTPLRIYDEQSNTSTHSFVVPQWGGIIISHPGLSMEDSVTTFVQQLRQLFGLPSGIMSKRVIPSRSGISDWEVDLVSRHFLQSNIKSTISTLVSMSNLIGNLTNMMVGDHIATLAQESILYLDQATEAISKGNYDQALGFSRLASDSAEKAFFDHQMLALLYFPDEHKLAIYALPFLGIMLQFFSGIWYEFKAKA
jgi:phosphatidylinositol glycan class S